MDRDDLSPFEALDLAVTRAGSQSAMARLCDVSQTAVWKWLNESKQLPAEYVLRVELATGVTRHDLRPDIYPRGLQDDVPHLDAGDVLQGPLAVADESGEKLQAAGGAR